MVVVADRPVPRAEHLDFSHVSGVRVVPVVTDWRSLARDEFVARADTPMVFKGLGAGVRASGWDREFFRAFGGEPVQMRARASKVRLNPDTTYDGRESVPLREFIAALDAGDEGVYAAEWYLFEDHPELLQDAISAFPDYLLVTPEAVEAYLDVPPAGYPAVTFYAADVGPGDAIYVPWRWAHQVENIGESIAVSRYYVSRENYAAAVEFFQCTLGRVPALLLQSIIGTHATRVFFKRSGVRRWLAHGRSAAVPRSLVRRAMGQRRR